MPEYASLSHHPGSAYIVASVEAIPGIGAWGAASGVTALKARVSNNTAGISSIGSRYCAVKAKTHCCSVVRVTCWTEKSTRMSGQIQPSTCRSIGLQSSLLARGESSLSH